MVELDWVIELLRSYGLWLLVPLSVLEGPIVTVVAGYLASLDVFHLATAYVVVVLGDLVGDAVFYYAGRHGVGRMAPRWRDRLGLNESRIASLTEHFGQRGGRTLVFGKLTHSAGAAILVAAGAARMPFLPFLFYNLLATLPKSALFLAIGFLFGQAYVQIDIWIFRVSLILLAVVALVGVVWWRRHGRVAK
jgi:membrane protein DedA with SNARE-associated domain